MNIAHKVEAAAGARNLLLNCAGCAAGETVLFVYESSEYGYFEDRLCGQFIQEARRIGLNVQSLAVCFSPNITHLPDALLSSVAEVDVVVFLARLGDQLRFSEMPKGPRYVVCFANSEHLLGSTFGTADYRAFVELKHAVDRCLFEADRVVLTCPAGTRVEGQVSDKSLTPEDTTSLRFPLSVFSPVPAQGFSGRVALGGFLTGTGSRYYDDYTIEFSGQVYAHLEGGRLIGFSGAPQDVDRANAHYDRVASLFGIDRNFVHSWHAGIHPGCGFPWDMRRNYELWGGSAFGNPRILHFHTCGAEAPGEISWNLFDPTIEVDGVALWEDGIFYSERLPGGSDILADYPSAAAVFANPDRHIGFGAAH